jgi:hypothetical protein
MSELRRIDICLPRRPGFNPEQFHVKFVVDEGTGVSLCPSFFFGFTLLIIIPPLIYTTP